MAPATWVSKSRHGSFNVVALYRLFTGQLAESDLVQVVDAEGLKRQEMLRRSAVAGSKP